MIVGFDLHRTAGTIIATSAAIVAAFAIALLVARGVTRPLRDLAAIAADTHAIRVAEGSAPPDDDMLPPRYTHSAPPLSDLATAVAEGRRRATAIVSEQRAERRSVTDVVASLALRNERLLGAALDALAEIGRRDHEPSTAAAIARVHRIVARVDRSTASALVLVGEGGRIAPHPTTITDAVWAAALAVESSDRVDAESLPPATLHADVVGDVTHLLVELIDNAVGGVTAAGAASRCSVPRRPTAATRSASSTRGRACRSTSSSSRTRGCAGSSSCTACPHATSVSTSSAASPGATTSSSASASPREGGVVVRVALPPALLTAPAAPASVEPLGESSGPAEPASWVHSVDDELARPEPVGPAADACTEIAGTVSLAVAEPEASPDAAPVPTAAERAGARGSRHAPERAPEPEPVAVALPAPAVPESIPWTIDLSAIERSESTAAATDDMLPRPWATQVGGRDRPRRG